MGGFQIRKLELVLCCTFFLALTLFALRGIIFSSGVVINHDWTIPPYRAQIIQGFPSEFFSSWQNGADITINSRGGLVLGLFNRLASLSFGFDGEVLTKAYLVMTLSVSGLSMYLFGRSFKKSWAASLVASTLYMLGPWLFDRIIAGDFSRMFAYMLFPLIFYLFVKSINSQSRTKIFLNSISIGLILLFVDDIAIAIVLFTLFLYSAFNVLFSSDRGKKIIISSISLGIVFSVFLISNLYWLIPSFLFNQQPNALSLATLSDLFVRSSNNNLLNTIRTTSNPVGWFLTSVNSTGFFSVWNIVITLIPISAFAALIFRPKDKNVLIFSLLAGIFLFLGKGINPPLGSLYSWSFLNIPFMQIFRDSDKWVMIIPFAYSFLLLFSVDSIITHLQKIQLSSQKMKWLIFTKIKNWPKVSPRKLYATSLVLIMFLTLFFASSYPFFSGDFGGELKAVNFPSYYQDVTQWLSLQNGDFHVLWLPPDIYTQYDWIGSSSYQQHDLMAIYSPKPNFMSYSSDDIGHLSYFVASSLYNNSTEYIGKILASSNVKYLILRNDADGWWWRNLGWTKDKLNYVMSYQSGLKLVAEFGAIDVYLNQYYNADGAEISLTNNVSLISGGFSTLTSLSYTGSNDYSVFVNQIPQDSISAYTSYARNLVIKNGDFASFVFSFVPKQYVINVGSYAAIGDKELGWATLYGSNYWWLNPSYIDSVEESAITSINASLNIPFSTASSSQQSDIWIKSFSTANLSLIVSIDGISIGEITSSSFDSRGGYFWVKIGSSYLKSGNHNLSIINNSSMPDGSSSDALVSNVAVVPSNVMKNAISNALNLANGNITLISEAEMSPLNNTISLSVNGSFGMNASQGLALTALSNHSSISYNIFAPVAGTYTLSLRAYSPKVSNLDIAIDGKDSGSTLMFSNSFEWFNLTTQFLSQGSHVIGITMDSGVSLDMIMLQRLNQQNLISQSNSVSYKENSPTDYSVSPQLKGPAFLVFNQPYSSAWKAYDNGIEIPSIPVNSAYNIFLLDKNAGETINIRFIKESSFEIGVYAAFGAMIIVTAFTLYLVIRKFRRLGAK